MAATHLDRRTKCGVVLPRRVLALAMWGMLSALAPIAAQAGPERLGAKRQWLALDVYHTERTLPSFGLISTPLNWGVQGRYHHDWLHSSTLSGGGSAQLALSHFDQLFWAASLGVGLDGAWLFPTGLATARARARYPLRLARRSSPVPCRGGAGLELHATGGLSVVDVWGGRAMRQVCLYVGLWLAACTYEPPARSVEWYANPVAYDDASDTHPERERFQRYLDAAVKDGLPGVVMLVRSPNQGTWTGAAGYADLANEVPWRASTLARAGSVTKLFASAVILKLSEQDELTLDSQVGNLLSGPAVSEIANADQATVQQLLNHTSGIFDYLASPELLQEAFGAYEFDYHTKEQLLEYAYGEPAAFEPGKGWKYCNTNFLLLELIAEAVAGRSGPALMKLLVIDPLGLRSTSYAPDEPPPQGLARGYADLFGDGALNDVGDLNLERFHFDGGVVSNVYDLADFLDALLDSDYLSSASRDSLLKVVPTHGQSERGTDFYGAGIIREDSPQFGPVYGHLGTTLGFTVHVYRIIDSGITFAAIVNGSQGVVEQRSYKWFSPLLSEQVLELVSRAE